jgi:S-disulfanyl-L-cysteine oxidoreductase SoxD
MKRMLALQIAAAAACSLVLAEERPAIFTAEQADRGRAAYRSSCIKCHTDSLIPPDGAKYMSQQIPPLAGSAFLSAWGDAGADELARRIDIAIGGFPPQARTATTHLDLTAYVLQFNGALPGDRPLTPSTTVTVRKATARE